MTMDLDQRLTDFEIQLAHQSLVVDELNAVVTRQAAEIDRLSRRVALLMQRAAQHEADQLPGSSAANQKPPHY